MAFQLPNFTTSVPASYFPLIPVFDFERNFDNVSALTWFHHYWPSGFVFCFIYVVLIYLGQRWMEHRERFNLKIPLTIWSLSLAIFSWVCALRMWSEVLYILPTYGLRASVCDPVWVKSVAGFWAWLFTVSKLVELGDTAFIVLRKQKLIFLHWYHHVTVLLYTWGSYAHCLAPARYFGWVNITVHAVMYTYYAAKASKLVHIPKPVSIFITVFQISQMVVGMWANIYALYALNSGYQCGTTYANINISFLMYFSYFLLFVQFFYKAYFSKSPAAGKSNGAVVSNGVHVNGSTKKEL